MVDVAWQLLWSRGAKFGGGGRASRLTAAGSWRRRSGGACGSAPSGCATRRRARGRCPRARGSRRPPPGRGSGAPRSRARARCPGPRGRACRRLRSAAGSRRGAARRCSRGGARRPPPRGAAPSASETVDGRGRAPKTMTPSTLTPMARLAGAAAKVWTCGAARFRDPRGGFRYEMKRGTRALHLGAVEDRGARRDGAHGGRRARDEARRGGEDGGVLEPRHDFVAEEELLGVDEGGG